MKYLSEGEKPEPKPSNKEIWYTTTNGEILEPSEWFEGNVTSNVYQDGKGIMTFADDITDITELFDMDEREDDDTQLTNVTLPDSVEIIGDYTFYHCSNITNITITSSVTSIGEFAFAYCSNLTSIVIPSSVTSIGNMAFQDCTSLTEATVEATTPPTAVSNILSNCSNLTSIYVPSGSVDTYKAASGWSTYASKIVAIS